MARVRRLDYRGECLLVRVKLACGLTKANGRICEGFRMTAQRDAAACAWGRRPKASREGTRGK
jgi:hypothetical protein